MTRPELVSAITKIILENDDIVVIAERIADRILATKADAELGHRKCATCKYENESLHVEPCSKCWRSDIGDNWQPKESEKCDCNRGKILVTDENYENEREITCRKCGGSGYFFMDDWGNDIKVKCDCKNKGGK